MTPPPPYCVVLATVPDKKVADKVTMALLQGRLAACVNQVPGVRSYYWWQGAIENAGELLLVIKTRTALLPEVCQCVKENHTYSVPEAIGVLVADGYKPYLDWVGASTLFAPAPEALPRRSEGSPPGSSKPEPAAEP